MKYRILQKIGFQSKHNTDCWEQKEYIGFGVASHSYLDRKRYSNTINIEEYIQNINSGNFGNNINVHEEQTNESTRKRIYATWAKKA